jgi:hypothetical protein
MFNPKTIILIAVACFAVALGIYLYFIPNVVTGWFGKLPFFGQSAVVLFAICLLWLLVSQTLIKKRK